MKLFRRKKERKATAIAADVVANMVEHAIEVATQLYAIVADEVDPPSPELAAATRQLFAGLADLAR